MIIDIIEIPEWHLSTTQKQVISRRQFVAHEIIGWVTGSRIPLRLGVVTLPKHVDIKKLVEMFNADLQL